MGADHTVVADDVEAILSPAAAGLTLDVEGTVDAADDQPLNPWTRLVTLVNDREVAPVITGEQTACRPTRRRSRAGRPRTRGRHHRHRGHHARRRSAADGRRLDRDGAAEAITDALAAGGDPADAIELPVEVLPVAVDHAEAQRVLEETVRRLSAPVAAPGPRRRPRCRWPRSPPPWPSRRRRTVSSPSRRSGRAADRAGGRALRVRHPGEGRHLPDVRRGGHRRPSVDGTGIDPANLAEQLMGVLTSPAPRSVTADLGPVPADFTTEEAQALGITEEIGSFTTRFTSRPAAPTSASSPPRWTARW